LESYGNELALEIARELDGKVLRVLEEVAG